MHICACAYGVHVRVYACVRVNVLMCVYMCVRVCGVCAHTFVCVVYAHTHLCVVYVHTHTHYTLHGSPCDTRPHSAARPCGTGSRSPIYD